MITAEQIDELNKLGYEMGISYDPLHVGHSAPFTLRTIKWDDDTCQYENECERFETFQELKAYLS